MAASMIACCTILLLAAASEDASRQPPVSGCLDCHDTGRAVDHGRSLTRLMAASVHAGLECTDCHAGIELADVRVGSITPHGEKVPAVDCGQCHEDAAKVYVKHGRLKVASDPDIPACWSCHGSHDILPSTDPGSRVHPRQLASACEACHANVDLLKHHEILRDEPIKRYSGSVHGRATKTGLFLAATCSDCHSSDGADGHRTAHRILSPSDPESTTHHFNIPETCGKCHEGTLADYWDGVHGQLVKKNIKGSPVCTDCHGEHGILPVSDMRSPVSASRLAEATCARCHESEALNERFGIPAGRLKTYVDSYHGLKRKAGNVQVANCASCHGHHRILSHHDPRSSIHPDNLVRTCGSCHPGISTTLARSPIHESATGLKRGWPRFFEVFYKYLIALTIGAMLIHNLAHWYRHVRGLNKLPSVERLTPGETAQHWVLMLSFIALVISGFALRFSDAWWVHLLFGWGGGEGFLLRGTIHRVSGVIFILWSIWHLFYLMTPRGRRWLRDMIAGVDDLRHLRDNALYFLGRADHPPRFARFTYMEKCEYWALIWGAVIMTVTGVLLWFDNYFIESWSLPKGILDVALVIHYYEAWLAFLAILVWHVYHTVFSPSVYPMNPAWLTGHMPRAMFEHEHPQAAATETLKSEASAAGGKQSSAPGGSDSRDA